MGTSAEKRPQFIKMIRDTKGMNKSSPPVLFTLRPLNNLLCSRNIAIEDACLFRDLVATTQAAIREQRQ